MSAGPYTLAAAAAALDEGATTSVALTGQCLDRIDQGNDALRAFLRVDRAAAEEAAAAADARRANGQPRGPLDGVPVAVKDNIVDVTGPTTAGSRILEGYTSPFDATVVHKLRAAGAVVVGKTNLDEFGMGSSTEHSAYGGTTNPWDKSRTPGGSSGGSAAAVAATQCYGALGTDTGGSVRQPAAFCGVAGLKPSYGRVSRFGAVAFASSLDQVGPFARDVKGCAHLLAALAGPDGRDATSSHAPVEDYAAACDQDRPLKVGVVREYQNQDGCDDDVLAAQHKAEQTLREAGATVVEVSLPHAHLAVPTYYIAATAEASSNLARYDGVRYGPRRGEEGGLESLYRKTRGELFGPEVKRRILLGTYVLSTGYYDAYYLRAQKVRTLIRRDYDQAFADVDVLLTPVAPTAAFGIGEKTDDPVKMYLSDVFTIGVSLAGVCGLSVNVAFTDAGLPLGVQLVGPAMGEASILRAGTLVEQGVNLLEKRPQGT